MEWWREENPEIPQTKRAGTGALPLQGWTGSALKVPLLKGDLGGSRLRYKREIQRVSVFS
ncbi:hypothetical protein C7B69_14465 [filamentous cyanobacterium Phorm 46]|nr:hypothetical protein C7B69_14465 [filamentous cyanobacterium Phorm 46]